MKTALVTGCSSGFGKQTVLRFLADPGWQVIATTRHKEDIGLPADSRLLVARLNVAIAEDRARLAELIRDQFGGRLDCLVNNAGYGLAGPLEDLSDEQIRAQFEVNFFAPLFLIRELLPALRTAQGKIINISSVFGFVGMPLQSLYVASKFALEGLSESLHHELSHHRVSVTLVEPGGFRTGFSTNVEWAAEHDQTAYGEQIRGLRQLWSRLATRKGNDPNDVAAKVVQLANSSKMPVRCRVGNDCHAVYYLRRSLPQQAGDFVLKKIAAKMIEVR
jgi:NAD(P)-dependent dehydrogenase (short-subunit alcohol dehydrogenase family)